MKRLKSIDIFRGVSVIWMLLAHMQHWWLIEKDMRTYDTTWSIFDVIGASAFLFIAGVSTAISCNKKYEKIYNSERYNLRILKIEYFLRTTCIFIIALLYNLAFAFGTNNYLNIWTWFILLTLSVSLFLVWPLLKTSKLFRILIGVIIWIANQLIYQFLLPYEDQFNLYGTMYYILYHTSDLDPILAFFPFLLFGTVLGEMIYEAYKIENQEIRNKYIKSNLIPPLFIIGSTLIIGGILFRFPMFLAHRTFPWMIYSLGVQLILISVLISAEEFIFKDTQKSYKFLFYFSYYSLSIYLIHNLLYFLFYRQLNAFNIWIYAFITILLLGLFLRFFYNTFGSNISLKFQISKYSYIIAKKFDAWIRITTFGSPVFISERAESKIIN